MIFKRTLSVLIAIVFLAACTDVEGKPKQTVGTLLGAGLGALAGSQIGGGKGQLAAVAIGALGGAWLGSEAGKSLDKADQVYAERTAQNTLENNKKGQTSKWRNPDSGHAGSYTPTRTYQTASGRNCREFETTVEIDGKSETATGTACRRADGTWKLVR
ncbi:MAG TPA: RT0821/Lpp0805 family surface protein [Rhodospirillales bacterium]|jgi:surface antigen|nr:RT0821/Lpp0805 family surface protein [Rhodospirillales bacterium]